MKLNYFRNFVLCWVLAIAPASQVQSQDLGGVLKKTLSLSAEGKCPANMMSPILLDACNKQMPKMGENLKQRGPISNIEFQGVQQTPSGPTDAYKVTFSGGTNMLWIISVGSDDKILVLWSGG